MQTNPSSPETCPDLHKAHRRFGFPKEGLQVIGTHADYRREDYMFQRTQSIGLRTLEWDRREKPLRPLAPNFLANLLLPE